MDYKTNVTDLQHQRDDDIREFLRVTEINALGKAYARRDLAGVAIMGGWPVEQLKRELVAATELDLAHTEIGLSAKETRQYSVLRAAQHIAKDPAGQYAGLEFEASAALEKKFGRLASPGGFFVPLEVQKRDLGVAVAPAGGYVVETQNVSFIDVLRNRTVVRRMGATVLSGLRGNISIPKQMNTAAAVWLPTETTQITEANSVFGQVVMTPKFAGGYTEVSRVLDLQSNPAVEGVTMADLAGSIGVLLDLGAIAGTGANGQPTGIINTAGIGGVTGTSIALAGILEFQTDLGNALAGNCGYVTTQAVAALLAARQKGSSTSSYLWEGSVLQGTLGGFPAMSSGQIPTANILFGDFSQVLIGEWNVLEVVTDPFTQFKAGIIGIRAMYAVDIAIRLPSAFSLATSVT